MNPEDLNETHLENVLRSLAPASPSQALQQRVDEELKLDISWLGAPTKPSRQVRWLPPLTWAALGAAAAVAVMSALPESAPASGLAAAPSSPVPAVLPVSTIREWEDIQDDGIHYSQERLPEQHVTLFSRERQTWIDPRDGAQMTVEYPREQKLVLPVSFQ
jgi:hypothetical protein